MDLLEIVEIKKAIKNITNEQTKFCVSPLLKAVI